MAAEWGQALLPKDQAVVQSRPVRAAEWGQALLPRDQVVQQRLLS